MNSRRFQHLIFLSLVGLSLTLIALSLQQSIRQLSSLESELAQSTRIVAGLYGSKSSAAAVIGQALPSIREPARAQSLRIALELSQDNTRPDELREAAKVSIKNELEIQKFLQSEISQIMDRIAFLGWSSLGLVFGFLILSVLFFEFFIYRAVSSLRRKMQGFLTDKYSYKFQAPGADELGQLEALFNRLAQNVIANMEELKSLDQAKSDFLSIASHELRTPMTSIKGSLSLLQMGMAGALTPQSEQLLAVAEKETDRLIRLINDLLDLAKVEARQFSLKKEWVNLEELMKRTALGLEGLAVGAGVGLQVEVPQLIQIHADADRIQQVLTNLLSNSIKFSPKGSVIVASASPTGDQWIEISVKDQGAGIAPSDQMLIFDKFRQATSTQNPLVKGTGLGLAIAKALVEEHKGQIGVQSAVGQGSTFYFKLPEWRFMMADPSQRKVS